MTHWSSLRRASALILALSLVPAAALGQEVTAVDGAVSHTDQTGGFLTRASTALPADLTAPNDYSTGTLHHRLTVTATPGTNETTYAICLVQGANEACSDYAAIAFQATGAITTTQAVDTFTNFAMLDWTQAIDSIKLVAGDTNGYAVDTTDNTMWAGSPDYALYYPLDADYVAVFVAAGETFSGFPGDPAMQAATPTFSSPSGSYPDSVRVDLASTTTDAEIYYTTDGSDPDDTSTLYSGTLTFTADTTLKAIAYAAGSDPSDIATANYTITTPTNGLRARYYNGRTFGELAHTRTDANIDFSWGDGESPAPDTQANNFSVLWTGTVSPLYSEIYTFTTVSDDGVRVWVNNQLIIDDWNFQGPTTNTGDIALQAGQQYDVWIEYFNGGGSGEMSFTWVSNTQPEEIVPDSQMTPVETSSTPTVSLLMDEDEYGLWAETSTDPIVMDISRRGALDQSVRVELAWSGTAVNGEDYEQMPAFIDIPAGALSARLEIQPIIDGVAEGEETIVATMTESGTYNLGQPITQEVTLLDFDVDTFNIAGEVRYTGTVSGKIFVQAFTDQMEEFEKREIILVDPGAFAITDVEEGSYNVIAFIDTNDNERLDDDEIWNVIEDEEGNATQVLIPPTATDLILDLDQPPPGTPEEEDNDDGGCCSVTKADNPLSLFLLIGFFGLLRARRRAA